MRIQHTARVVLISMATMASGLLLPSVKAEQPELLAVANVPFAFQCGSRTLPAGRYTFTLISHFLRVQGQKESAMVLARPEDMDHSTVARLTFASEDALRLYELWSPAHHMRLIVAQPRRKQPKRELAQATMVDVVENSTE